MKLGVNNHVNLGTKNSSIKPMAGGPSKINPPNSQPSNPIHKKATEAQGIAKKKPTQTLTQAPVTDTPATQTQTQAPVTNTPATQTQTPVKDTAPDSDDTHHINKALVGLGALALVGFVIWASKGSYFRFFSVSFWIMKAATARISSQAFLARNEIA